MVNKKRRNETLFNLSQLKIEASQTLASKANLIETVLAVMNAHVNDIIICQNGCIILDRLTIGNSK